MKPLRALIVEDVEDDAALMIRELRRGGYDPIYVRVDTAEAMTAALSADAADIVLSDYNMPHFDAFEALALLRRSGQDVPFIIVSGTIGEDRAVAAMKAGAHDYIMKGNLKRLVPAIERELGESRIRAERKEALDALRLQSAALTSAANAMVITDRSGAIEWTNPAFTALAGYGADEAFGANLWNLIKSDLHDPVFYQRLWATVLGGAVWQGEMLSRRKDGSLYPEHHTITPVRDDTGDTAHLIVVMRDLTTEEELRTALLAEETLRASVRFKDEFLGLVSHELRTPLTVMTGLSALLLRGRVESSVPETAAEIYGQCVQLARLLDDMLVISRLSVGHLIDTEPQMLSHILPRMVAECDRAYGLKVVCQAEGDLPIVEANETYLSQILRNLLSNAAKYGGGSGPIEVIARERAGGAFAEVLVCDRGPGVPEEDIARIFEPYFRSDSVKGSLGGLGLGLTVCKLLVEAQGGELRANRREGGGMVFSFSVPAARHD